MPPFWRVLLLSTCWNSSKILLLILRGDARAGVLDGDLEAAVDRPGADLDRALVGELDGVADEVQQHLSEPPFVAAADRQPVLHVSA